VAGLAGLLECAPPGCPGAALPIPASACVGIPSPGFCFTKPQVEGLGTTLCNGRLDLEFMTSCTFADGTPGFQFPELVCEDCAGP
jgi:hypothetical protein